MKLRAMLAGLAALGCDALGLPAPDLERMIDQPRVDSYERVPFFDDERGLRTPPPGTRPHGPLPERFLATGRDVRGFLANVPGPMTRERLEHGRGRYSVFCAPCHGVLGTVVSQVAENMTVRKPPSLVEEPIRTYPSGRIFQAISRGYGVMPAYETALGVEGGWDVVAYVRALQLRRDLDLNALPEEIRKEAVSLLR